MTRDDVLSVCDELLKLVPKGPAKKPALHDRALELVDSLDSILGLGALARALLVNVKVKVGTHFSSASGVEGIPADVQRDDLKADITALRERLAEDLEEDAEYGPERP